MAVVDWVLPKVVESARLVGFRGRWVAGLLTLQLMSVGFEGIGLGTMIPVLEYMKSGGNVDLLVHDSEAWRIAASVLGSIGLSVGLGSLLALAFGAVVLRQVFLYARLVYSNRIQAQLIYETRNRIFDAYMFANFAEHERSMTGEVINDMTVELERAVGALRGAVDFLALLALIAAYVLVVFTMSVMLSFAAGAIISVVGLVLIYLTRRVRSVGKTITLVNQSISSLLVERLNAVRLVRLSGIEQAEIRRLEDFTRRQRDAAIDLQRLKSIFSVSIEPLVLAFAFVLLFIAVEAKILAFEQIVVFFFILLRLAPVAREAMALRQSYVSLLGSVGTVSRRIAELGEAREPDGGERVIRDLKSGITFDKVSFRYPTRPNAPALNAVTLNIVAGEMTAIVGPSGAGKSTLVDLIPSLRSPDTGEIRLDGIPLAEYAIEGLRQAIAYVPQKAQILDLTAAEQIALGRASATREEIVEAARYAGADAFIAALPDGYNTRLGEGGGRLSGGQRQRLDLARAIVRGAPILILDEPTASLDAQSEAAFKEALERIRRETGMTIIIIGHRFSTVADADQIIVLEDGGVSETGTHIELMSRNGWYANAYRSQNPGADGGAEAHAGRATRAPQPSA